MADTVGDFIVQRLREWEVRRVFAYPGDGINGILGALGRQQEDDPRAVDFIQVRHEEMAAFMACAHAKLTGEPGVCLATSGPGAIHLVNGLYDAKLDHQPVVAIVGQVDRRALGGDYLQEVDLVALLKDVAHEYVQMAASPEAVRHVVDRAFRNALATRRPTCIIFPVDLQEAAAVAPPHAHGTVHSGAGWRSPRIVPADAELRRAASILNEGRRVAMLVGAGCLRATDEAIAVAEALGAGVAKALLGKAALPDDLPFVTGSIGLLGTEPSWDLMQGCDTLLVVGSSFPYSEFLPPEGQARGVQIDIDGRQLGIRYPMEVNLMGDAAETLRALLPLLERKEDRAWRGKIEAGVRAWREKVEARAAEEASPLNPQRVVRELSRRLPDRCIVTADAGTGASWFAQVLEVRRGMLASLSGGLASMGSAVPYAIAAKLAFPDRPAVAIAGDGAMQMSGLAELITIAKYRERWTDPRLVVLVLNNRDLNMVTWEQRVLAGDPKLPASQEIPDVPYAAFARSIGLEGIRIERPEEVGPAWERALSAGGPVVLEAVVDPDVPPLPPHISLAQAKNFAGAIVKGDQDAWGMLKQSLRQLMPRGRRADRRKGARK